MFSSTKKMAPTPVTAEKYASHRPTKVTLVTCTALYSVAHLILFFMSAVAWSSAKARANETPFSIGGIDTTLNRWGLYPFMTFGALVCFVTSAVMTIRSSCRIKGSPLDAKFIFRGIFYTLIIILPIVIAGWTNPLLGAINPSPTMTMACTEGPSGESVCTPVTQQDNLSSGSMPHIGSVCGTFVMETFDAGYPGPKPAMTMIHFNL